MSDSYVLAAEARDRVGKGSARAIRRQGNVPAVIYGDKQSPLSVAVSRKDVTQMIMSGGFLTTVGEIEVEGKKHDNTRATLESKGTMDLVGAGAEEIFKSKPIADFFPEATVMFADISGFTAWSSTVSALYPIYLGSTHAFTPHHFTF